MFEAIDTDAGTKRQRNLIDRRAELSGRSSRVGDVVVRKPKIIPSLQVPDYGDHIIPRHL